jgi:hypothetical protein
MGRYVSMTALSSACIDYTRNIKDDALMRNFPSGGKYFTHWRQAALWHARQYQYIHAICSKLGSNVDRNLMNVKVSTSANHCLFRMRIAQSSSREVAS